MAHTRRLPEPLAALWVWQLRAACRGMDSSAFFHPESERGPRRATREQTAQQICRRCGVIEECRRHALAVEEPYGVWGGLTETDRDEIVRARRAAARLRAHDETETRPAFRRGGPPST